MNKSFLVSRKVGIPINSIGSKHQMEHVYTSITAYSKLEAFLRNHTSCYKVIVYHKSQVDHIMCMHS